ncbi:hypothetical protein ACPA54_02140 [Uniformispora flossi]|uniref:hypothetical protein n=1 Tax=Uniformispora flossi TaxID=3390723 RepID=UPI003C2E7F32
MAELMTAGQGPTVAERVAAVLACLADEHAGGGVLLIDLDPDWLQVLATRVAARMTRTAQRTRKGAGQPDGKHPYVGSRVVTLRPWHTDAELWTDTRPTRDGFRIGPGPLAELPGEAPPVVVVPDLASAGPVVLRAVVTVAGADAASVEMAGCRARWAPRARWIAACRRVDAMNLSPHVLDRFPMRVDAGGLATDLRRLQNDSWGDRLDPSDLDIGLLSRWLREPPDTAEHGMPRMSAQACLRLVGAVDLAVTRRRDLSAARMARWLARSADEDEVISEHIDRAVALLGLTRTAPVDRSTTEGRSSDDMTGYGEGTDEAEPSGRLAVASPDHTDRSEPAESVPEVWTSYPEDHPDALPEPRSLVLHLPGMAGRYQYGRPLGSVSTRDPRAAAIVPTVLEAAKFQAARRMRTAADPHPHDRGLLISAADLRRYRRGGVPSAALVLLLDHSCRQGWDWHPALAPHLRWAYEAQAAVTAIELGHRDTESELRAERCRAASLLDPQLLACFDRAPGRATPLAHAIDLAAQEVRRFVRRGRSGVGTVLFVAVTDGRGNVPLAASLRGETPRRVGRRGVDDALTGARAIAKLGRVDTAVIAPGRRAYADLPAELAIALRGRLWTVDDTTAVSPCGTGPEGA